MRILTLLILVLFSITANAEGLKASDFAYGIPLKVESKGSLYQLTLPLSVYEHMKYSNFADIRVYNDEGQVVPYAILSTRVSARTSAYALPFFPIKANDSNINRLDLQIQNNQRGAIIAVSATGAEKDKSPFQGYLIDARKIKNKNLQDIVLTWANHRLNWVNKVKVYGSNDMRWWRLYPEGEASLAELHHGGDQVIKNTLPIKKITSNYLYLSWPDKPLGLNLKVISANVQSKALGELAWLDLKPTAVKDQSGAYRYHTTINIPEQRMQIRLPEENTIAKASVFTRLNNKDKWTLRTTALLFTLNHEGEIITNDSFPFPSTQAQNFLVRLQPNDALNATMPTLQLGWYPAKLTFIAKGSPPYMLVFGNAKAKSSSADIESFFRTIKRRIKKSDVLPASAGEMVTLSGKHALKEPINYGRIFGQIILWLVLIAGIAFIIFMAKSLWHQYKGD